MNSLTGLIFFRGTWFMTNLILCVGVEILIKSAGLDNP